MMLTLEIEDSHKSVVVPQGYDEIHECPQYYIKYGACGKDHNTYILYIWQTAYSRPGIQK